jgi:trigger factor
MKVTQEKLPASQIGLQIEITPEITKQKYEQVIRKLTNTVNIPGFRKGKVPRQMLIQSLGTTRVKATALEEIIQEGMDQAIKQEAITAIGQPQLRSSFDDLIINFECISLSFLLIGIRVIIPVVKSILMLVEESYSYTVLLSSNNID